PSFVVFDAGAGDQPERPGFEVELPVSGVDVFLAVEELLEDRWVAGRLEGLAEVVREALEGLLPELGDRDDAERSERGADRLEIDRADVEAGEVRERGGVRPTWQDHVPAAGRVGPVEVQPGSLLAVV